MTADIVLLVMLAIASYIQATTGFAFSLIAMAGITSMGLIPISDAALVVNALSVINLITSLKGSRNILPHKAAVMGYLSLCIPSTLFGIWLLDYFDATETGTLKMILGFFIVISSLMMLYRIVQIKGGSGVPVFAASGLLSGMMGGMFAAFGPPLTFVMYRQPCSVEVIRNTLVATFLVVATFRLISAISFQQLNNSIALSILFGAPVVLLAALAARRFPAPLSDMNLRRLAFVLLLISGCFLVLQGF